MTKLDKNNIKDILNLTPMQTGMLLHYVKHPDSYSYIEQLKLSIRGEVNAELFTKAWNIVIMNNEMLRVIFRWENVEYPIQIILKNYKLQPNLFDLSGISNSEAKICLEKKILKDWEKKFDLHDIAFRVSLFKLGKNKHEMLISNHHILFDGWSTGIILREFFEAYDKLSTESFILNPPNKINFKEYLKKINEPSIPQKKSAIFWTNYLKGIEVNKEVPIIKKEQFTSVENLNAEYFKTSLSSKFCQSLKKFTEIYKITAATVFYSTWGILLHKYGNDNDVLFGTTVSGRSPKIRGIETTVGLLINTLPLRLNCNSDQKISEILYKVNKDIQKKEIYINTSLSDIKEYISINPQDIFFDTLMVVENYPISSELSKFGNPFTIENYEIREMTPFAITVTIQFSNFFDTGIEINVSYDSNKFSKKIIQNLSQHFIAIIKYIINFPEKKIKEIYLVSQSERKQILQEFNNTDFHSGNYDTINQSFEAQVKKTPFRTSLVSKECHAGKWNYFYLSYLKLDELAEEMVFELTERNIYNDKIVGILLDRSIDMYIAIMAVLKSGGAYLPISPDYPVERKKFLLVDSNIETIIITQSTLENIAFDKNIIPIEKFREKQKSKNHPNCKTFKRQQKFINQSKLAYAIYTSGSTGKPKGVLVEHKSVLNILLALNHEFPLKESDSFMFKTSFTFDVSIAELFGWFSAGGRLIILQKNGEKNPIELLNTIELTNLTHINFVPTMFYYFQNQLSHKNIHQISSLKYIFLAGEELLPKDIEKIFSLTNTIELVNIYGPTEGTIYSTKYSLGNVKKHYQNFDRAIIPIGQPFQNIRVLILDNNYHLQPIGVSGELFISGIGISRGYLNHPNLTKKYFIENPLKKDGRFGKRFKRLYRSGDLCRWLFDGNIEFLGRLDHQVKIRGYRIELGEIESQILKHPEIKDVRVIGSGNDKDEKYLLAVIVPLKKEKVIEKSNEFLRELKDFLSQLLPDYMIPAQYNIIKKIPLNPNGKLDRKALPKIGTVIGESFIQARNITEQKLATLWSEILFNEDRLNLKEKENIPKIGIDDNFFELGGHSLKQVKLISKIHKTFNVKIALEKLIQYSTIRKLSLFINDSGKNQLTALEATEKREFYILALPQKRFYIFQKLNPEDTSYNLRSALILVGKLDKIRLEKSFRKLIKRHEGLRTSFKYLNGEAVQIIHEQKQLNFEIEDIFSTQIESALQKFIRPFDLSKPPLLRVGLLPIEEEKHLMVVDMHHIITDGISEVLLAKEFIASYSNQNLPKLRLQYKDYTLWQNTDLQKEKLKRQEIFWINQFKEKISTLNLPSDFTRPEMQTFAGNSFEFEISVNQTSALKKIAIEEEASLFMVLLSIYNILLAKLCNQEDIIVGTGVSGRKHADLMNIIGLMFNTIPLRNHPTGEKTFIEFLRDLKDRTYKAFENQEYPFDKLVEELQTRNLYTRDLSRNPLFDTMFAMQNFSEHPEIIPEITINKLTLKPYRFENLNSRFDLFFMGFETKEAIKLKIEYSTSLFKKPTILKISNYYLGIIEQILENLMLKLSDIKISSSSRLIELNEDFVLDESKDMGFGF